MSLVNTTIVSLPHGNYTTSGHYEPGDTTGVVALAIAAGMSCVSVVTLLALLILSATHSFQAPGQVVFIRTHVAAYFVSLLFCDFWQSIGSLLNIRWIQQMGVMSGVTCTAQAAIKNGGNVGTAIWSLVIAVHTFAVLFCGRRPYEPALYITLILVWTLIGLIVVLGPSAIEDATRGPYFGISGLWCWITEAYPLQQLLLEYIWMFTSAGFSLVLYLLIWLKLRGNLVVSGWRWRLRRATARSRWDPQAGQGTLEAQVTAITRQMMLFPIAYFIIIMPIAACRYADWAGNTAPFPAVIFADVIFLLQGFINVVLFCCTRNVIPADHDNMLRRNHDSESEDSSSSYDSHMPVKAGKPKMVQHAVGVISLEPARAKAEKHRPPRLIHAVVPSHHQHSLSREGLGKVNANYAPAPPPPPKAVAPRAVSPRMFPPRARTPLQVVNHTNTRWDEDSRWAGITLLERPPSAASHSDSQTDLLMHTPRSSAHSFEMMGLQPPTVTVLSVATASPASVRRAPSALELEAATRRTPPSSVPNTARPPTPASQIRRSHSYTHSDDHSRTSRSDSETQHVFLNV